MITGRPARKVLALGGLDEVGREIGEHRARAVRVRPVRLRALELDPAPGRLAAAAAGSVRRSCASCRGCCATPTPRTPSSRTRASRSRSTPAGWPTRRRRSSRLEPRLRDLAERYGLVLEPGRQRDRGPLARHAQGHRRCATWRRRSTPAAFLFAGDDLGDVEAFEAVAELAGAGPADAAGLLGVGGGERPGRAAPTSSSTAPTGCWTCSAGSPPTLGCLTSVPLSRADRRSHPTCGRVCTCVRRTPSAPRLQSAHREGLRERPVEAPATAASLPPYPAHVRRSRKRCQFRPVARVAPGKMRRRLSHEHCRSPTDTPRPSSPPCARAPSATPAPCLPRVRPRGALGPFYACPECFGPLEVGYDFPAVTREQIEAGPENIWRYQPLLPVPDRHHREPQHRARLHPAAPGRQPGPRARHRERCGSRTTPATRPTPSRTASSPAR